MFKETQNISFCEAVINIVLSICLVFKYGLYGVAIGTVISAFYRFLATIHFLKSHIINRPVFFTIKKIIIYFGVFSINYFIGTSILPKSMNMCEWVVYGFVILIICIITHLIIDVLLYKDKLFLIIKEKFIYK